MVQLPPEEPYTHPAFPDKVSYFFVKIQRETHTITKVALVRAALELTLKELSIETSNLYEAIQEKSANHLHILPSHQKLYHYLPVL